MKQPGDSSSDGGGDKGRREGEIKGGGRTVCVSGSLHTMSDPLPTLMIYTEHIDSETVRRRRGDTVVPERPQKAFVKREGAAG